MDDETREFARSYVRFVRAMEKISEAEEAAAGTLTEVGDRVRDFLGVDPTSVEPVTEIIPEHQVVDLAHVVREVRAGDDRPEILVALATGASRTRDLQSCRTQQSGGGAADAAGANH